MQFFPQHGAQRVVLRCRTQRPKEERELWLLQVERLDGAPHVMYYMRVSGGRWHESGATGPIELREADQVVGRWVQERFGGSVKRAGNVFVPPEIGRRVMALRLPAPVPALSPATEARWAW